MEFGREISLSVNNYLETMRGLDELTRSVFGVDIIDHDFAPEHSPSASTPGSLLGFSRRINDLIEEIPDSEPNSDIMRFNLASADFVIGALSKHYVIGGDMDYRSYVAQSMGGIRPSIVPEAIEDGGDDSLEYQRQKIEELVECLGFRYDSADIDSFNKAHSIPADEIQETVEDAVSSAKKSIAQIVGPTLIKGLDKVEIEVIQSTDTYQGYFGTKDGEFIAQFNANPLLKLSHLEELLVAAHELTHGVSSTNKERLIGQDDLSATLGILPSFSPMYFQEEVAARAVELRTAASQSGTFAEYIYRVMQYKIDVHNNMLIIANSGFSEEEVASYGCEHLPFDEPDKIKKDAELYRHNLLYKTVFAVDQEAMRVGRKIASFPQKAMQAFVVKLCSEPISTAELLAL